MALPIYADVAFEKTGPVKDSNNVATNYKQQILVQSVRHETKIAQSSQQGFAASVVRPEGVVVTVASGEYIPEFYQAHFTGDKVKTFTITYTTIGKDGMPADDMIVKVTGGVVSKIDHHHPTLLDDENDKLPSLYDITIAYQDIEVQHKPGGKQMTYSWKDHF